MDTREHILISASKLFLKSAYKEVTMKDIMTATGLSKGALYHHFTNKEDIFQAVLQYFMTAMEHRYDTYSRASFRQFYLDYIEDTIRLVNDYSNKFGKEDQDKYLTFNNISMIFDAIKLFPDFKVYAIEGFNQELRHWAEAASRGKESGELQTKISDMQIGEMFLYLSDGVGLHMIIRGHDAMEVVAPIKAKWEELYALIKK